MTPPRLPRLPSFFAAAALAAAIALPGPPGTGASRGLALAQDTAARGKTIARVEAYLNGIKTIRSRFLQIGPTGEVARGTVLISRPGKLRIEYDPPSPVLILTENDYLMLYDKDLESRSYASLSDSLAGFLVRAKIGLSGDVEVRKVQQAKGVIRLTIVQSETPEAGKLTLVFSDDPLVLRQWVIVDGQGGETRVSLENPRFNLKLGPKVFEFTPPEQDAYP